MLMSMETGILQAIEAPREGERKPSTRAHDAEAARQLTSAYARADKLVSFGSLRCLASSMTPQI